MFLYAKTETNLFGTQLLSDPYKIESGITQMLDSEAQRAVIRAWRQNFGEEGRVWLSAGIAGLLRRRNRRSADLVANH